MDYRPRARAHCANKPRNENKHWEEADTREELIQRIIAKELWNVAVSTKMTRKLMRIVGFDVDQHTWQSQHDDAVQHVLGKDETVIIPFVVEFDDGTTQEMDINLSSAAVTNAGVHLEVGLV